MAAAEMASEGHVPRPPFVVGEDAAPDEEEEGEYGQQHAEDGPAECAEGKPEETHPDPYVLSAPWRVIQLRRAPVLPDEVLGSLRQQQIVRNLGDLPRLRAMRAQAATTRPRAPVFLLLVECHLEGQAGGLGHLGDASGLAHSVLEPSSAGDVGEKAFGVARCLDLPCGVKDRRFRPPHRVQSGYDRRGEAVGFRAGYHFFRTTL